jgi:Terpene cyclase DEP1
VGPWGLLGAFISEHGFDPHQFVAQCFATPVSTMAMVDLLLSAAVFLGAAWHESRRLQLPRFWLHVVLCFTVGLCFSLPVFLLRRQRALEVAGEDAS